MNHQIVKLQTEMDEIATPLATLTQQVISHQRKEALRELLSFAQECVDTRVQGVDHFENDEHWDKDTMNPVFDGFKIKVLIDTA